MPVNKCTHRENRLKVCGPCGKKIVFRSNSVSYYSITNDLLVLVKKFCCTNYNLSDERFPLSICVTCRLTLVEHGKENEEKKSQRPIPKTPDYENISFPKHTRSQSFLNTDDDLSCNYFICVTGRFSGHEKIKKGRGLKRLVASESKSTIVQNNDESDSASKVQDVIKLCKICFQEIGKGKSHACGSKTQNQKIVAAKNNVLKLVNELPEKQKEQIASSIIKQKFSESNEEVTLSTSGKQVNVSVKKESKNLEPFFPTERLDEFQVKTGATGNHMKELTGLIRECAGKKAAPVNYARHVSERAKLLDDLYHTDILDFESGKNKEIVKRPVVYAIAEELVNYVVEKRNFVGEYTVKVMADGGQGFLKVLMSIIPATDSELNNDVCAEDIPKKRRKLDSSDVSIKWTSVKKLIILCIGPDIKENYVNVKILFDLIKINDILFKFASDFKVLLIVNGQQTASALFPCPYCYINIHDMRKGDKVAEDNYKLKTFGDLNEDYEKYVSLGSTPKFSKECHSTVNKPLFVEESNLTVLKKCILPVLHILLGFVNHLFFQGLVPLLGREKAMLWPLKLKIISKNYQGEKFEGNACREMIKKPDHLLDSDICEKVGPFAVTPYVAAFKAMNKIVNFCFTTTKVENIDDIDDLLKELSTALLGTEISISLKLHVLQCHLKEALQLLDHSETLGSMSEQEGESAHRAFNPFFEKRKINLISDSSYPSRLKSAVVEFSSLHIA